MAFFLLNFFPTIRFLALTPACPFCLALCISVYILMRMVERVRSLTLYNYVHIRMEMKKSNVAQIKCAKRLWQLTTGYERE